MTLFDAMVDSLYASFEKLGGALSIVILNWMVFRRRAFHNCRENAAIYNSKLVPHVLEDTKDLENFY
ncbi:hypothetical protein Leryth_027245 [Lithospermum erythrorhizon]|nr:hypothetical protein Leryth_027245 [Lithospermum erythrorhizon]